jgi:hypothetical protein
LIAVVYEAISNSESTIDTLPTLVWGSVFDCLDVFDAMSNWEISHCVLFKNHVQALFSIIEGETVTERLKTVHEFQPKTLSCGPCLPSTITNLGNS